MSRSLPAAHLFAAAAVLAVAALSVSAVAAQEKPHPIAAQVKASLSDPARPFAMVVTLKAKEGAGAKVEAAFTKAVKATRREKGCLAYDLNRDAKAPLHYLLYERWRSLADLEAHLKSQHIAVLLAELEPLLAAAPEVRVLLPAGE
jgi:quinol monooxygenase YgiN